MNSFIAAFKSYISLLLLMLISLGANLERSYAQSTEQDDIKKVIIAEYAKDPSIQDLLAKDVRVTPQVTGLKDCGPGCYQAIVELGLKLSSGSMHFGYFGNFLKILNISQNQHNELSIVDVTKSNLPKGPLWAHYKITTGQVSVAKNPNSLSKAKIRGVQFYYVASSIETSDVFIPIQTAELMLGFRILLLNPKAASMFWIQPSGTIALSQMMSEESDGNLGFALKGGGKTGWSPWTHEFIEIVSGAEKQKFDQLKNENARVLPAAP